MFTSTKALYYKGGTKMKAKTIPKKRQVNWRLSDTAREIIRTLAALDRRSQSVTLEIILEAEAARRGIVVKITK